MIFQLHRLPYPARLFFQRPRVRPFQDEDILAFGFMGAVIGFRFVKGGQPDLLEFFRQLFAQGDTAIARVLSEQPDRL